MIEIQKYPCNDGNEARAREEYWRCHFNAQLNTKKAHMTDENKLEYKKEYYELNKDKILEQRKEYYEAHKDRVIENMKTYYYNKKNKTDSSSDDSTECITH